MPIRNRLSKKEIHRDFRRLRSIGGAGPGSTSPHTLLGIVHSDTATAAPVRGAMVLADDTPEWTELPHPGAAGYALVTDAADVAWDQTPTWTGSHTWDDGAGDSPSLVLVGGSNDDTASIYLDDDAVAGNSDLVVRLVADDDDARLIVEQSGGTDIAYISGVGNAWFEGDVMLTDDAFVGISAGGRLVFDTTPNPDQVEVTSADLYFATANHGIIHVDGNAAGSILVADGTRYVPGDLTDIGAAPDDAQYVVMALDAGLSAERVLTGGNSITLTDGGAGGNATLDLDTPGTLTVATANNAAAPHLHTVTSSSNPGAAASLLASDANGQLQILRLGIGTSTASDNSAKFADDGWAGLAFNGGRFVFDSTPAPDTITVEDGDLVMGGGDSFHLDEYLYHSGDADTYIRMQADRITLRAGGTDLLDLVEAATDYVLFGAMADLNGNDLIIDTDGDTYLHEIADDHVGLVLNSNLQYDWDAVEMTFTTTGGTPVVWIRAHGDVTNTSSDFYCDTNGGFAADDSVYVFIDANSSGTSAEFVVAKDDDTISGATALFHITEAPKVFVNETVNASMTVGLSINQGTNDDEILALMSTDITHPFTTYADDDTFGQFHKNNASYGGTRLRGLRADSSATAEWGALSLVGYLGEAGDVTKTTAGRGIVEIEAGITNGGTAAQAAGTDENLLVIRNFTTTRYIFDAEGSAHADVEWTTFDEHDDLALLDGLEASFGEFAEGHRRELEALGIAHFDDTPGHAMVNWTRLSMLLTGAVRQLAARVEATERRLLQEGA